MDRFDRPERTTGPTTIACTESDAEWVARVLGAAFADDPVISWMFGDQDAARRDAHRAFGVWVRRIHLAKGAVVRHAAGGSVACWAPPDRWRLSITQQLRLLPSMAGIFGITRLPTTLGGLREMADRHPTEPHWYLAFLGTVPAEQGRGLASDLLAERLAHCDRIGAAAYLEASRPANVPFYERVGFRPVETFVLPDGPPVTTMWRDPR